MHVGVMQEWSGTGSRDGISKLQLESFVASLVMLESVRTQAFTTLLFIVRSLKRVEEFLGFALNSVKCLDFFFICAAHL